MRMVEGNPSPVRVTRLLWMRAGAVVYEDEPQDLRRVSIMGDKTSIE